MISLSTPAADLATAKAATDPARARMHAHSAMSAFNEVALDSEFDWEIRASAMRQSLEASEIVRKVDAAARQARRRR